MNRQQPQNREVCFLQARNETDVLRIFRDYRDIDDSMLAIWAERDLVFPVEPLDRFYEAHPQLGQQVTQLTIIGFHRVNADRMLEFICTRFPKIKGHTILTQLARLPELNFVQLPIRESVLKTGLVQHHAPFTQMRTLKLQYSYDHLGYFEASIPRLFPNVTRLNVCCGSVQFKDQLLAKARVLFPRLTKLHLAYPKYENGEWVGLYEMNYEF